MLKTLALIVLIYGFAHAQTFEVASVRPAATRNISERGVPPRTGGPGTSSPDRITYRAVSIRQLVTEALGVKGSSLQNPDWMRDVRFDIVANLPPNTTPEQLRAMWLNLLTERFGLKLHREMQEHAVYSLVLAKTGAKLQASERTDNQIVMHTRLGGNHMAAMGVTLQFLAEMLESWYYLEDFVVNKTGLNEHFDFTLAFANSAPNPSDTDTLPSLSSVLEKELGVKVERTMARVEVVVLDQASETPTEN